MLRVTSRHALIAVAVLLAILVAAAPPPVAASAPLAADAGRAGAIDPNAVFARDVEGAYLCARDVVQRAPDRCPPYGPGTRQVRRAYLASLLPNPLPGLSVEPLPVPEGSVTRYLYGQITNYPAPTYRHPAEAEAQLEPVRVFRSNINWASVMGTLTYNGEAWVQINPGEYIRADHIAYPEPSRFQGIALAEQPALPFAWLRLALQPSPEPGAPPSGETLARRTIVTIYATETVGGRRWNMIGPGQWVNHDAVAQVTPRTAPSGVPAGVKWIEVDTYEQTLAAYEGNRMVYATLVTAGKADLTPLGLFRIFRKVRAALMQSYDRSMDDPYWFHLEDVEHAQFFNDRISLHAAYWHDAFGSNRSNGCVNLAPLDARWLYAWTDPQLEPGASWVTAEAAGEGTTWVWVHHSGDGVTHKTRY